MTKRKNRKPKYQVRQPVKDADLDTYDPDKTGAFVSARPSLSAAEYQAKLTKAESFNIRNHDLMLERDTPDRIHGWLGESDFAWSGEQAVKLSRKDIPLHDSAEPVDPRLPQRIADEQIDRIIYEHPSIAMEGLAKLGRIMHVPMTSEKDSGVHVPPFNGLELKTRVAHDLGTGSYANMIKRNDAAQVFTNMTADILDEAVLVDIQPVYDRWMAGATGNDIYDLRLAPPWNNALLVFNNTHGNVWAMHMVASDIRAEQWSEQTRAEIEWQPEEPADHKIDWSQVRWVYSVQVYVGGLGKVTGDRTLTTQQTIGPLMVWRVAVYEDGVPADVHWSHIAHDVPFHKFNNALGAFSETLNMCNCVNVHVAYPSRPMSRAQRRRLDRLGGVRFSEVHIRPASKSYKGNGTPLADMTLAGSSSPSR